MATSQAIVAAIVAKYPQKKNEAERGCEPIGQPIVSKKREKVGGSWVEVVVSTHQKYRLGDGTVVPLEYIEPPPVVAQTPATSHAAEHVTVHGEAKAKAHKD